MDKTEHISNTLINEQFCSYLEYHLSRTLAHSENELIRGFWCDGILVPLAASQIFRSSVIETRKIVTKAWIGKDGQGEYEMIIKLGKRSLNNYAQGINLQDCVPSENSMDWIEVNVDKQVIEIQLQ